MHENCGKKCKSLNHGQAITNVLLSGCTLPTDKVAAFIVKKCKHFRTITDSQGYLAIHVAAECNRYEIVEWLLNEGVDVNACDEPAGQTALHHAIQSESFETILVLLQYGAAVDLNDHQGRTPACFFHRPHKYLPCLSLPKKEIFVWGANRNYNLGLNNKVGEKDPYFLDYFHKQNVAIDRVSLSKYHCLYVDDNGGLYVVGLGDGGRLGTNKENTLCVPRRVFLHDQRKGEIVVCVSAARDHSLVLTSRKRVFATGRNQYGQLGRTNVEQSLIFREVDLGIELPNPREVIASKYHSLVYTKSCVLVWGTNYGQFGQIDKSLERIDTPMELNTFGLSITRVVCNDIAICCQISTDSILLFANHTVRTIYRPFSSELITTIAIQRSVIKINVPNGKETSKYPVELLVMSLSFRSGNAVHLWSLDDPRYVQCLLNVKARIEHIDWIDDCVYAVLTHGRLYKGKFDKENIIMNNEILETSDGFIQQSRYKRTDLNRDVTLGMRLTRVTKIDRVLTLSVDESNESFVALQGDSMEEIDKPRASDEMVVLKDLLNEVSEADTLHDVVFHVQDETFPAHKFVVFSRAEGLRDIILSSENEKHIYLQHNNLTARMFAYVMKYIYIDYTLTIGDLEVIESSCDARSNLSNLEICSQFRELLGVFGVAEMYDRMMLTSKNENQETLKAPENVLSFDRVSYPDLYDITIECANDVVIMAHRCIISSQLDYFNVMLSHNWSEATNNLIKLHTVPAEYMKVIIDYLYHNDIRIIRKQQYKNSFIFQLTEVCDRFMVQRLKDICEILLIERMNIRNCLDKLEFAGVYNCEALEATALKFICYNMGRLLDNNYFDGILPETWARVAYHYRMKLQRRPDLRHVYETNSGDIDGHISLHTYQTEEITEKQILDYVGKFTVNMDESKSVKKPKQSERSKKRQNYEEEALNAIKRVSLSIESPTASTPRKPDDAIVREAEQIAKDLSNEAARWMKVPEKKDVKSKILLAGLKSNEVLRNEPKEKQQFTPLKLVTPPKLSDVGIESPKSGEEAAPSVSNFSLSDFTPLKSNKLSQKQRRRQLSQSEPSKSEDMKSPSPWKKTPETPEQPPNPWNLSGATDSSSSPINIASPSKRHAKDASFNDQSFSAPSGSLEMPSSSSSFKHNGTSFTKILADERKQKEYYIKMKNKPLHLTQIEEKAIDELKAFYNVENLCDEHIVVERCENVMPTVNFAQWTQK